jgi:hypothetical protein
LIEISFSGNYRWTINIVLQIKNCAKPICCGETVNNNITAARRVYEVRKIHISSVYIIPRLARLTLGLALGFRTGRVRLTVDTE